MLVKGRTVATTTGKDIEEMKVDLHRRYFNLPDPTTKGRRGR